MRTDAKGGEVVATTYRAVVKGFGEEWRKFDQSGVDRGELREIFDAYFAIFPWEDLPPDATGFDLGCGSGRWAYFVAPKVGRLHCIDPSLAALEVARKRLRAFGNCELECASAEAIPLADDSADFGYSIGVLQFVPSTSQGIEACVRKLKPGAPFLIYLYYALENRPLWFRAIWRVSDVFRQLISRLPFAWKSRVCDVIAALVYWPLARFGRLVTRVGLSADGLPVASYRNRSFYVMRNDALDRFGTRVEKRFTKQEIERMMHEAGLEHIRFSEGPYWCATGRKTRQAV
jgi:SAM-dependent methyltransferase